MSENTDLSLFESIPHRFGARWWEWWWPGGRCFPPLRLPWSLEGWCPVSWMRRLKGCFHNVWCVFIHYTFYLLLCKGFGLTEKPETSSFPCVRVRACMSMNAVYIYGFAFLQEPLEQNSFGGNREIIFQIKQKGSKRLSSKNNFLLVKSSGVGSTLSCTN